MITDLSSETNYRTTIIPSPHPPLGYYKIIAGRKSMPAYILFARHISSKVSVVLKLLYEYKDTRYNLETVSERQRCQLEAIQWNRLFTPNVHIGLAHICSWDRDQKIIELDEIIENPSLEKLSLNTDYVLLMRQLPTSRRLDYILTEESNAPLQRYTLLLTRYVVHIHTNLTELTISKKDAKKWGSFIQLRKKLVHNLEFLDQIIVTSKNDEYSSYYWLKDRVLQVFKEFKDLKYFEQRVQEGRIKRCHADLKAPNIWIAPLPLPDTPNEYWYQKEPWKYIYLMDAVDFNPMYSNIDILSDFAMLVIDIQARTKSSKLANLMIEEYLRLTNQQDKVSRLVLNYYLVEKALICAAVSILYDNAPNTGLAFLETAELRMIDLYRLMSMQQFLPAVNSSALTAETQGNATLSRVNYREDNTAEKGDVRTIRRKFSTEFKAQLVVELLRGTQSAAELCRQHKLSPQNLSRWKREFLEHSPHMYKQEQKHKEYVKLVHHYQKQITNLERLVDQLIMELDNAKMPPTT